jgi:hypothetical protein
VRIGWTGALWLAVACKDPGGIPVVRAELGQAQKTPHYLTELIVLTVNGQDLTRVESSTGLYEVVYQGVTSSWPLPDAQAALVRTNNGDLERVSLSGTAFRVISSDDPADFAGLISDPNGKLICWTDPAGVLHVYDPNLDVDRTYLVDGVELEGTPRVVTPDGNAVLVSEAGSGRWLVLPKVGDDAPAEVVFPPDFTPFQAVIGVNGVRIGGLDGSSTRVMVADEFGELAIDAPLVATWTGRAALDKDGLSVLSLEEEECLSTGDEGCEQSDSVLVRYTPGDRPEIVGRQTVVGLGGLLDGQPELSPDGDRLLLRSTDGLWFIGNPEA